MKLSHRLRKQMNKHGKIMRAVILLLLVFLFALIIKIFGWMIFLGMIIVLLGAVIFIFHKQDKSIPYVSSFLQTQYFKTKFLISVMKNRYHANECNANGGNTRHSEPKAKNPLLPFTNSRDSSVAFCLRRQALPQNDVKVPRIIKAEGEKIKRNFLRIKIILNRVYLKLLHYFILLTKNSKEGFEILREELQEDFRFPILDFRLKKVSSYKEKIGTKNNNECREIINQKSAIKNQEEWIDLENLTEKVKRGEIKDTKLLEKLVVRLYEFHKRNKQKAAVFSLAGLSVIVITTVVSSLLMTTIFPNVFKSNAASYTWTQTDWSAGANAATTGHPASSDWNKFASASNIYYSGAGEVKLATSSASFSETFTGTTYKDTANTTANWNIASGQVEFPAESVGTDLWSKLNGVIGGSAVYATVMVGDEIYIGAGTGRFAKYNKNTDAIIDLTPKISSFWTASDIYSLAFDSQENVIYLGGKTGGKFARYNTPSYAGGGTYPSADTAYDLTSKVYGFWNYSLVFDSANNVIYIGSSNGSFVRYNTTSYTGGGAYPTADTAYNLTSKISSFWGTDPFMYALSFDSANNVIYLGGQNGNFARYNTTSYIGGGTYPDQDTAYNLSSKISSFWSTNTIYSLSFDSDDDAVYLGGQSGKFARYNTDLYAAGGTYPDADTAYNLTSKISNYMWNNIKSLAFDSGHKIIYLGDAIGAFVRYNTTSYVGGGTYPTANTAYDLTSKIPYQDSINTSCFDLTNNVIYLGATGGRFYRYNTTSYSVGGTYPAANTVYNLTSLINIWGGYAVYAMAYAGNNEIYIGGASGKFAKYNTQTQTVTDLTSKISSIFGSNIIYALSFDSVNNVVYLGGYGSRANFARYNTASYTAGGTYPNPDTAYNLWSKISFLGIAGQYYAIYSFALDSAHNVLYIGGQGGVRLARYNTTFYAEGGTYPDADTVYDLKTKISISTTSSLAFDSSNNVLYIGAWSGGFGRYNTTSYTGGGTYPDADAGYDFTARAGLGCDINSITFDSTKKFLYLGGLCDFTRYNTTLYNAGGTYSEADHFYSLYAKISSFWTGAIYSLIVSPQNNNIYIGGGTGKFASYDITSDAAVNLRSPDMISFWGSTDAVRSFSINSTTGGLYVAGNSAKFAEKIFNPSPSYAQSLTFDSLDNNIRCATLTKNDTPGAGAVTYYLSNNGGTSWLQVTPGSQATFSTTGSDLRFKIGVTSGATVQDVSINYWGYNSQGNLISSAYNTNDAANVMAKIEWNEGTLPNGTDLKFQIRTAPNNGGVPGVWSDWLGPTGTDDYYTAPLGTETINAAHTSGSNDQWFQYQAFMTSNGKDTPVLSDVTLTYVVNAPPQVQNVIVSQGSNGQVAVSYEVRDPDTSSGSAQNQGHVTPSFQYWNGASWVSCTTMASGNTDQKSVNMDNVTWTAYTATWTPTTDYANHFMDNTCKIRVTASDGELANATGYNDSATFILDTKAPASASVKIDARTNPATLTIAATDDSSMQMKIGTALHGGSAVDYSTSGTVSLATDPDTVYVDFIDAYGNMTSVNATTPETPTNFIYRDVTNIETSDYQIFIAWKEISEPAAGFKQYNIYAKENDGEFSLVDTVDLRTTNYYMHKNLSADKTYYYKVAAQTDNDDISGYTAILSDKPNGQGGTDVTAPTISNVQSSAITTTQAKITWDTDEISSSTVLYITETGGDFSEALTKTENSMKDNSSGLGAHQVILTGLTPGTDYYYKVKSSDPFGNTASSTQGVNGYTFTTLAGAIISNVTASDINNNSATITWNTDIDSDSYVVYSTNSTPTGDPVGADTLTQAHAVGLSGLNQGTKYYYYVKSTDGSHNLAQDNNGGAYYTFTTTADNTGPVISSISAQMVKDTSAMISWLTDENATSKVWLGTVSGTYSTSTVLNTNLDLTHAVKLENLTANKNYYYIVVSRDGSNNTSTSTEQNFTTLEKLSPETQVTERETTAKSQGMAEQKANTTGGGVMIIDKTDKTAPIISGVNVSDIGSASAKVSWRTDEAASGFVEYGENPSYGKLTGHYTTTLSHLVNLENLKPEINYHYRVASIDSSGNLAQSQDQTFTTLKKTAEEIKTEEAQKQEEQKTEEEKKKEKLFDDIADLTNPERGLSKEEIFVNAATAAQKAMDVLKNISSQVSIETAEQTLSSQFEDWKNLTQMIPAPLMSGEPRVITTATTAIITWRTDRESNSLVALAPEGAFSIAQDRDNPYIEVRGNREDKIKEHVVTIYELKPETTYHYQLRSQGEIGPMAKSSDFTFKTKNETLEISNYAVQNLSNEKAIFKWVTNLETDSQVKYIPYRDNKLMVDEAKAVNDKAMSIIHELEIPDFEAGVIYSVELSGKDMKGQIVTKEIPTYSTSKDDLPPIIYQVQTDSALSPGKDSRVQTIISWQTNEPSTQYCPESLKICYNKRK